MPRTTQRTRGGALASLRTPKARALLIGAADGVAAVAAWGGPGGGDTATPSDTAAGAGDATADTPVIIGSATKSFTALAVLRLAEDGRLSLDQPAVHHVLDHRCPPCASGDEQLQQLQQPGWWRW